MSAIRLSDYQFFLKTYCLGHQLLAKCDHKMQQLYLELLCEDEQKSRSAAALRAVGTFIDQSLCLNKGRLSVLAEFLAQQQTGSQDPGISINDYAWVLNEQQNVLALIGRRAPELEALLGRIERCYAAQAWHPGITVLAQLREFQAHAASIREKMFLSSQESQAFLERMSLVQQHERAGSFETLMQQLKGYKALHSVQPVVADCKSKRRSKGSGPLQSRGE